MNSTPSNWPMFVSRDGSYGDGEEILIFDYGQLTARQWEIMESQTDYDRHRYVQAVLNNWQDEIDELEEGFDD